MHTHQKSERDDMPLVDTTNQLNAKTNDMDSDLLMTDSTQATNGINLNQLDKDCLREIFLVKSLDLTDLCSLSETCKKFREITHSIVPKSIYIATNEHSREYYVEFRSFKHINRKIVERIFKCFGSSLSEVRIKDHYAPKDTFLLQPVTEHCTKNNLKCLKLTSVEISDINVKLKSLLKQIQKLDLFGVRMTDDPTLFYKLDSLVELKVCWTINCGAILGNSFPKLERFEYRKVKIVMADSIANGVEQQTFGIWSSFITRHVSLKSIKLELFDCDETCRTNIIRVIGNCCKELEELCIDVGSMSVASLQPWQTLKSLRSLELRSVIFDDFKLLSEMPKLRELILFECDLPNDSDQFFYLSHVTNLELEWYYCQKPIDALGIISRTTNLQKLLISVLEEGFELDEESLSEIVAIVSSRSNMLTVECKYNRNSNRSRNLKLKNNVQSITIR